MLHTTHATCTRNITQTAHVCCHTAYTAVVELYQRLFGCDSHAALPGRHADAALKAAAACLYMPEMLYKQHILHRAAHTHVGSSPTSLARLPSQHLFTTTVLFKHTMLCCIGVISMEPHTLPTLRQQQADTLHLEGNCAAGSHPCTTC